MSALSPKRQGRRVDKRALIDAVLPADPWREERSVEIDESCALPASSRAGATPSEEPTMLADHHLKPSRSASATRASASVRPPALSSLTLIGIIAPAQIGKILAVVKAFVGADRDEDARCPRAARPAPAGSGCSMSADAIFRAGFENCASRLCADQASFASTIKVAAGTAARTAAKSLRIAGAAELQFEQRPCRPLAPPRPWRPACRARS